MKPSNFTLNSDYLSIAQVSSNEYTVYLGGGTLTGQGYTDQDFDFAITAQKGAIDRIMIKNNSDSYQLCSYMPLSPGNNIYGFIQVYRTSATNLRAKVVLENYTLDTQTYPAMTFNIKVSSFKPPNVF